MIKCPQGRLLRACRATENASDGEVLQQVLTPEEVATFTPVLKPQVEASHGRERRAVAYLTAVKC